MSTPSLFVLVVFLSFRSLPWKCYKFDQFEPSTVFARIPTTASGYAKKKERREREREREKRRRRKNHRQFNYANFDARRAANFRNYPEEFSSSRWRNGTCKKKKEKAEKRNKTNGFSRNVSPVITMTGRRVRHERGNADSGSERIERSSPPSRVSLFFPPPHLLASSLVWTRETAARALSLLSPSSPSGVPQIQGGGVGIYRSS